MPHTLTVISEFECHYGCPYCYSYNHSNRTSTVDSLNSLNKYVNAFNIDTLILSGSGDPLYRCNKHIDYFDKFLEIGKYNNVKLHIETSFVPHMLTTYGHGLLSQFDNIEYHLHNYSQLKEIKHIKNVNQVVSFLITPNTTPELLESIIWFVRKSDCIDFVLFKQMVGPKFTPLHICEYYTDALNTDCSEFVTFKDEGLYYMENMIYSKLSSIYKF